MKAQRLREIKLCGVLGRRFGFRFRFAVSSPGEAIRALSQIPGFDAYMMRAHKQGIRFAVFMGRRNLNVNDLGFPPGRDEIRLVPIFSGAKKAGVLTTILGAVLIVVGAAINIISAGALSWLGTPLIYAGVGLMAAGVVQMMMPMPKGGPQDRPENKPSEYFTGPVNTVAQGNPVPLLYGEMIVGSAVFSAGIIAEDVHVPVSGTPNGGIRGGGGSPPWHLEFRNQTA